MYKDESGNIITAKELKSYYTEHREEIYENSGAATFAEYLSNCLSKNGSLEELR